MLRCDARLPRKNRIPPPAPIPKRSFRRFRSAGRKSLFLKMRKMARAFAFILGTLGLEKFVAARKAEDGARLRRGAEVSQHGRRGADRGSMAGGFGSIAARAQI